MYTNDAIHRGKRVFLSAASLLAGLAVIQTAAGTVSKPTDGIEPSFVAISTATAAGEQTELYPLVEGDEVRLTASAAISAGAIAEFILSGADAGKIRTLTSGLGRVEVLEAATAAGDYILCRVLAVPVPAQAAPNALNASGTITLAMVQAGILTSTTAGGAVAGTIDTGALLDAGGKPIRGYYDLSIINTGGANAFTFTAAAGVTIVGAAAVAANTTGLFRLVRTAAETWIAYRRN